MLVLNTTSPRASPSAPAASPRKTVPSSSARIASMCLAVLSPSAAAAGPAAGRRPAGGGSGGAPPHAGPPPPPQPRHYLSSDAVTLFCSAATTRTDPDQRR